MQCKSNKRGDGWDVDETQEGQSITGREGEVISKPGCKNKNKTKQKNPLPVLQAFPGEFFFFFFLSKLWQSEHKGALPSSVSQYLPLSLLLPEVQL